MCNVFWQMGGMHSRMHSLKKRGRTAQVLVNNCVTILYWSCIELVVNSLDTLQFSKVNGQIESVQGNIAHGCISS